MDLPHSHGRSATRQEIDDTQELNYRFIANAIAESGYTGFVAHEHRPGPGRDPIKSLEECFAILNVQPRCGRDTRPGTRSLHSM